MNRARFRSNPKLKLAGPGHVYRTLVLLAILVVAGQVDGQVSLVYEDDALLGPRGINFDSSGNLLVAGYDSDSGYRISPDGSEIERIIYWATLGPANPLRRLVDMVGDSQGNTFAVFSNTRDVYKIDPAGNVSVFVEEASVFSTAFLVTREIEIDANDNLYLRTAFDCRVFKITPDAEVTIIRDGGVADMAVSPGGTVYITQGPDVDNGVLRILPSGVVEEVVPPNGMIDGLQIDNPFAIAIDHLGYVYVTGRNTNNLVRVAPDGSATELMGIGSLTFSIDLQVDADRNAFAIGGGKVFRITPTGEVSTWIGAVESGLGERFRSPRRLAVGPSGQLAVSVDSNRVFVVDQNGIITEAIDAHGVPNSPGAAGFSAMTVGSAGETYIAGGATDNVLRVSSTGVVDEFLGPNGNGSGHALQQPVALTLDALENLYVVGEGSNNVFQLSPGGDVTEVLSEGAGYDLDTPTLIDTDDLGRIYVACLGSAQLLRWTPGVGVEVLFDSDDFLVIQPAPVLRSLSVQADGTTFLGASTSTSVFANSYVFRIDPSNEVTISLQDEVPPAAFLGRPLHLSSVPSGVLYVGGSGTIYQVRPSGETQLLYSLGAFVSGFSDMEVDWGGNLFATSEDNHEIVRFAGNAVETVLDTIAGGVGSGLRFPDRLAVGADQSLYVSSGYSTNVYRIDPSPPSIAFVRGDADGNGSLTVGDGILVLDYLFQDASLDCLEAADFNASGSIDLADAVFGLSFLFAAGDPPSAPFPDCGPPPSLPVDCALPVGCP